MRSELFAVALLLGGLLVVIMPAEAQAGITWTVETVDATPIPRFGPIGSNTDYIQPYPAVNVLEESTGIRRFYEKSTGVWVSHTVATIADQLVGGNGGAAPMAYTGGNLWELVLVDDGADLLRYYTSNDDGTTWTATGTVANGNTCGPMGKLGVDGTNRGIPCDSSGGTDLPVVSANGGAALTLLSANTACVSGVNGRPGTWYAGGTTWVSVAGSGASTMLELVSGNNCSTAASTIISTNSAGNYNGVYSKNGNGALFYCNDAGAATREVCWNPGSPPVSSANTEVVVSAADLTGDKAYMTMAENGTNIAVILWPLTSASEPQVILSANSGVDWSLQDLPATVDAASGGEASAAFVDGALHIFYKETTTNDLKVVYSGDLGLEGAEAPTAPAGLSATVALAHTGTSSLIDLRWPVSSNDPDLVNGSFAYSIFINGVNSGIDPTTTADGDGLRFNRVNYNAIGPANLLFWIVATNTTSGRSSIASCSVQIYTGTVGDFDQCGDLSAPLGGGVVVAPSDTAAGLLGFCASLMGESDGSLFLCGLIFVVAAFLAMAGGFAAITGSTGLGPTIAGSVAGFGMMVFNVFAGIWGIVWAIVLIILVAAIITVVVKKFTGASGGATDG